MEKRFLVIVGVLLLAAFFASYTTDHTGEVVRASRVASQQVVQTSGEGLGTSSTTAAAETFCACPVVASGDVTITQNDCTDANLAVCRNAWCRGTIEVKTPTGQYERMPFERHCKVYKRVDSCNCPGPWFYSDRDARNVARFYSCNIHTPCPDNADVNACQNSICTVQCVAMSNPSQPFRYDRECEKGTKVVES